MSWLSCTGTRRFAIPLACAVFVALQLALVGIWRMGSDEDHSKTKSGQAPYIPPPPVLVPDPNNPDAPLVRQDNTWTFGYGVADDDWVRDWRLARDMDEFTDCAMILRNYSWPLAPKYMAHPTDRSVLDSLERRKKEFGTYVGDLHRMCELRKKRIVKLREIKQRFAEKKKGTADAPILIHPGAGLPTWRTHRVFTWAKDQAMAGCRAKCEFTHSRDAADVVMGWEYCDNRFKNPPAGLRADQVYAFAGYETIYPSYLDVGIRKNAQDTWPRIDIFASGDRFAELGFYFADTYTLHTLKNPDDPSKNVYPPLWLGANFLEKAGPDVFERKKTDVLGVAFIINCGFKGWSLRSLYRANYIGTLSKFMPIHGGCGKVTKPSLDRSVPHPPDWAHKDYPPQTQKAIAKCLLARPYKFHLAFENGPRDGYVSEKLWQALWCPFNVVVYMGAPDVSRFFTAAEWQKYRFFVNANDFADPRELAEYLQTMSDEEYRSYFQWRIDGVVPQSVAVPNGRAWTNTDGENISYPCRVCELLAGFDQRPNQQLGEYLWYPKAMENGGLEQDAPAGWIHEAKSDW